MREKGRKIAKYCVFLMICGSGGSKSRLTKAAGAEPAGQMRDEKWRVRNQLARWEMKNCMPLWREPHFQVKMFKTHRFGLFLEVEMSKKYTPCARSTFPSQNAQNTPGSDHFLEVEMSKSIRRCGAKHISKSKCTNHLSFGPLLENEMSKKCTRTFPSQNVQTTSASDHFWKMRCRKSARRCGAKHISKSKCIKRLSFGPLLEVEMSKKCTPLWREGQKCKKLAVSDLFWKLRCRKSARRCGAKHISSQNGQNTSASDHFWKLRCRKSARRCGAKVKSVKNCGLGPLLEVEMSKKCTPLCAKHISKSKCTKHTDPDHFWKSRCRKSARRCGAKHILKSKVLKLAVSDHVWKLDRDRWKRERDRSIDK